MNPVIVVSIVLIALVWAVTASQRVLIPYVIHLLVLVTSILYVGCHTSIDLMHRDNDDDDDDNENENGETKSERSRDTLRKEDAYHFPIVGSVSLFGLYLAFKFLGKEWVNLIIGIYFATLGVVAIALTWSPLVKMTAKNVLSLSSLYTSDNIRFEIKFSHPFPEWALGDPLSETTIAFSAVDILGFISAMALCILYYTLGKPWYLNNVLAICFCLQGIAKLSLGTYKIGAILLVGLFFYDIFWVFGTDVMVTVAKNLDGPIKLLFPRSLEVSEETGQLKNLSLLGLGDIVIPGFFLALLLRFDAHKAVERNQIQSSVRMHDDFPKPYFHSALLAYIAGLGTTLFVMIQFNAAQPALLYLVPACLGSSFLCAMVRGEVRDLLEYSEEEEEEEEDSEAEKKTEDEHKSENEGKKEQ
jgi:minor histocompatibility antigen H13